jgi:hypothetical protein
MDSLQGYITLLTKLHVAEFRVEASSNTSTVAYTGFGLDDLIY